METVELAFNVTSTDYSAELGFSVALDDNTIIDIPHVDKETPITLNIEVDDGDHELKFTMRNKTENHTTVDKNNNILTDARLKINNLILDDIELHDSFTSNTVYYHDFNGTGKPIQDQFYGDIGCNGTVVFKFHSPIYIWFLGIM
jgi:hypothetical protein